MATRTINSPGVEIREKDLTLVAPPNVGTTVFVPGFAAQGPLDEVIKISTREELDLVYGRPTNSAERYFYYTVNELLNSPANIYTTRLPYGSGGGVGFGSKYSALAYPVRFVSDVLGATLSNSTSAVAVSGNGSLRDKFITFGINDTTSYTIAFSASNTATGVLSSTVASATTTIPYLTGSTALVGSLSTSAPELLNSIAGVLRSVDGVVSATIAGSNLGLTVLLSASTTSMGSFGSSPFTSSINYREVTSELDTFSVLTSATGGTYVLGEPTHVELNDSQYRSIIDGSAFEWSSTGAGKNSFDSIDDLGKAGLIVLNKAQTTINDQYEGYYVGVLDNSNINPGTNYDGIVGVRTVNATNNFTRENYVSIPEGTLQFNLSTQYFSGVTDSVSLVMENLAGYDINGRDDDDLLNIGVFKLKKSIFADQAYKLDYVLEDGIVGSINYHKTQLNPRGGPNIPAFLETRDEKSRNVTILVNDYVSDRLSPGSMSLNGVSKKRVRALANNTINTVEKITNLTPDNIAVLSSQIGYADKLFGLGAYSNLAFKTKALGNIPQKIQRALDGVRNDDIYDIDIVVEGGLGTINVAKTAYLEDNDVDNYDEYSYGTVLSNYIESLRTSQELNTTGEYVRALYHDVFSTFESFCSPPYDGGGRGDCIFVADVLRHILITGKNNKVIADKVNRNFQKDIYWAMRHQLEFANTSYATVYGNWGKVYDNYTGRHVWIPFSGYAAAAMANSDAATFPWVAPAGFTRGLVSTSSDIAVNPNQKQRDELYKSNINPVAFFPSQGQVIYGQKTLLRKPSAFDRINVRRLFLALERPTKKAAQYFVFEPNTVFTRTRISNVLEPIFERAKSNDGLYDYVIVCDERNNTGEVIDNNELVVDIYIKPVRTAEFILVNFYATRTDARFEEIIGA
jgi:hypothetical protein